MSTINCKGELIALDTPKVMGVLNITPDSFYDGGRYLEEKHLLIQAEKMLTEGAAFIDIGAYSSRPGATHISEEEELKRLIPVLKVILKEFPEVLISVDTFRSKVAHEGINVGAAMVNDISGGKMDKNMLRTIASLQVPYICMHMQGTPQNMQQKPKYNDVVKELIYYFSERVSEARALGINDFIIDPGFGFGKTIDHNYEILKKLELFSMLELPVLVGLSRKSMIYKKLDSAPEHALNGTTSLNSIALFKGAKILRVHDVKEAVECITLVKHLL